MGTCSEDQRLRTWVPGLLDAGKFLKSLKFIQDE